MDIDELASAITKASNDPVALRLSDILISWKNGESNAVELERDVERFIGNTWIANTQNTKKSIACGLSFETTLFTELEA